MAKIRSETSRAIEKTSTPVRNVFLFRFLRATEKKEICAMVLRFISLGDLVTEYKKRASDQK
jgi:hypothetical protein